MIVNFKRLSPDAKRPTKATQGSKGYDLTSIENVVIEAKDWKVISTGIAMEIPEDEHGEICPRSGLAAKHALTVLNSPGIIDSDYRLALKVILINHGRESYEIKVGDKIAQLIFNKDAQFVEVLDQLSETDRKGGFGSTGK